MIDDIGQKELDIEYPCRWRYKLIAISTADINNIVKEALKEREYTLNLSHKSQGGNYKSYNLELLVFDESDRTALFEKFKTYDDIKFVL
jgi:putative lipoic acid-binding regulatory protein